MNVHKNSVNELTIEKRGILHVIRGMTNFLSLLEGGGDSSVDSELVEVSVSCRLRAFFLARGILAEIN